MLQAGGPQLRGAAGFRVLRVGVRVGQCLCTCKPPGHMALQASEWVSGAPPGGRVHGSFIRSFIKSFIHLFDSCVSGIYTVLGTDHGPRHTIHLSTPSAQGVRLAGGGPWAQCADADEPWAPCASGRRWPWAAWG